MDIITVPGHTTGFLTSQNKTDSTTSKHREIVREVCVTIYMSSHSSMSATSNISSGGTIANLASMIGSTSIMLEKSSSSHSAVVSIFACGVVVTISSIHSASVVSFFGSGVVVTTSSHSAGAGVVSTFGSSVVKISSHSSVSCFCTGGSVNGSSSQSYSAGSLSKIDFGRKSSGSPSAASYAPGSTTARSSSTQSGST